MGTKYVKKEYSVYEQGERVYNVEIAMLCFVPKNSHSDEGAGSAAHDTEADEERFVEPAPVFYSAPLVRTVADESNSAHYEYKEQVRIHNNQPF